jgi:hypothetical protein
MCVVATAWPSRRRRQPPARSPVALRASGTAASALEARLDSAPRQPAALGRRWATLRCAALTFCAVEDGVDIHACLLGAVA